MSEKKKAQKKENIFLYRKNTYNCRKFSTWKMCVYTRDRVSWYAGGGVTLRENFIIVLVCFYYLREWSYTASNNQVNVTSHSTGCTVGTVEGYFGNCVYIMLHGIIDGSKRGRVRSMCNVAFPKKLYE